MRARGFTLMELLLVLALIALLASLVTPIVTGSVHRARESTLKEDLFTMRKAIDDYYADNGSYPADLETLVQKRYLRRIPADPITERQDSWAVVRTDDDTQGKGGGIIDVHSGSGDKDGSGVAYRDW